MKRLVLLLAITAMAVALQAQCLNNNDIFLTNQQSINNFAANYPNCTDVPGNLFIGGGLVNTPNDIVDLTPLSYIQTVGGDFTISNTALTSLAGMENLTFVGGYFNLSFNNSISNLDGLDVLSVIHDNFSIHSNSALANLSGLDNLHTIDGTLFITHCSSLSNLSALSVITNLGGSLSINNNDLLTNLSGLEAFTTINGYFSIDSNPALTDLSALSNLQSIGAAFFIRSNDALTTLEGLEGLTSLGYQLEIKSNGDLTSLEGLANLTTIADRLTIKSNPSLLNLAGLENLQSIGSSMSIESNEALINLEGLEEISVINGYLEIKDNHSLTSLTGLEGLTIVNSSLEIASNESLNDMAGLNNLNTVNGDLKIQENASLMSLNGLESLTTINRDLEISGNDALTNLTGLESLTTIDDNLEISDNASLNNLEGLSGLTAIGNDLEVFSNNALSSLAGLGNLDIMGSLKVYQNNVLLNLSGLEVITSVFDLFIVSNSALSSLSGLENLHTVNYELNISDNPSLANLSALDHLTWLGFGMSIRSNNALTSLPDFPSLTNSFLSFTVENNANLSTCNSQWVCANIDNPEGVYISFNANAPGCNSNTEVENSCPNAVCQNTTVALQPGGGVMLEPADIDAGSTGFTTLSVNPSFFDCDDLGDQLVILTATDNVGNSNECYALVAVVDGEGLPNDWAASDVGNNPMGNDYNFEACNATPTTSDDQFTISGSGNNAASSTTDNIAFSFQTLCGDGSITAKIESVSPNGYGGLMIRETTDAGAKQTSVFSNLSNNLRHEARYSTNGPKQVSSFFKPAPYWLKLERQGDWVFAYYSSTGANFQYVHGVMLPMQSCVEIGLASFTYLPNAQTEAVFSNVTIMGSNGTLTDNDDRHAINRMPHNTPLHLSLFPNPTSANFTLQLEAPLPQAATVQIFNLYGQPIAQQRLAEGQVRQEWDTAEWTAGTYVLKVQRDGQPPLVKQFVVMK